MDRLIVGRQAGQRRWENRNDDCGHCLIVVQTSDETQLIIGWRGLADYTDLMDGRNDELSSSIEAKSRGVRGSE